VESEDTQTFGGSNDEDTLKHSKHSSTLSLKKNSVIITIRA